MVHCLQTDTFGCTHMGFRLLRGRNQRTSEKLRRKFIPVKAIDGRNLGAAVLGTRRMINFGKSRYRNSRGQEGVDPDHRRMCTWSPS